MRRRGRPGTARRRHRSDRLGSRARRWIQSWSGTMPRTSYALKILARSANSGLDLAGLAAEQVRDVLDENLVDQRQPLQPGLRAHLHRVGGTRRSCQAPPDAAGSARRRGPARRPSRRGARARPRPRTRSRRAPCPSAADAGRPGRAPGRRSGRVGSRPWGRWTTAGRPWRTVPAGLCHGGHAGDPLARARSAGPRSRRECSAQRPSPETRKADGRRNSLARARGRGSVNP